MAGFEPTTPGKHGFNFESSDERYPTDLAVREDSRCVCRTCARSFAGSITTVYRSKPFTVGEARSNDGRYATSVAEDACPRSQAIGRYALKPKIGLRSNMLHRSALASASAALGKRGDAASALERAHLDRLASAFPGTWIELGAILGHPSAQHVGHILEVAPFGLNPDAKYDLGSIAINPAAMTIGMAVIDDVVARMEDGQFGDLDDATAAANAVAIETGDGVVKAVYRLPRTTQPYSYSPDGRDRRVGVARGFLSLYPDDTPTSTLIIVVDELEEHHVIPFNPGRQLADEPRPA